MKVTQATIPSILLIEPKVFDDDRGCFFESYNQRVLDQAIGYKVQFVQDNQSQSKLGVIRGLHYQKMPDEQGKLVRVIHGSAWDVCVDIRQSSPTFGMHVCFELSAENGRQLWIPPGFAHGFLSLSHQTTLIYKTTNYYSPSNEATIRWDDPDLAISWPELNTKFILSEKDKKAAFLKDAVLFS